LLFVLRLRENARFVFKHEHHLASFLLRNPWALSSSDLNRCFINAHLHALGKLYLDADLESFMLPFELLSKAFRAIVSRSPMPVDSTRLVQIVALNMFVVGHTRTSAGAASRCGSDAQVRSPFVGSGAGLRPGGVIEKFILWVEHN
jgi:hypothetical protein